MSAKTGATNQHTPDTESDADGSSEPDSPCKGSQAPAAKAQPAQAAAATIAFKIPHVPFTKQRSVHPVDAGPAGQWLVRFDAAGNREPWRVLVACTARPPGLVHVHAQSDWHFCAVPPSADGHHDCSFTMLRTIGAESVEIRFFASS